MKFEAILFIDNQFNEIPFKPGILESALEIYSKNECNYGEFNRQNSFVINLQNVSHKIDNIRFKENNVLADFEILNTPSGKLLEKLIENQYTIYPRILGRVENNQIISVEILTFDIGI